MLIILLLFLFLLIVETSAVTSAFITYRSFDAEIELLRRLKGTGKNLYVVIHVSILSFFFFRIIQTINQIIDLYDLIYFP